MAAKVLKKLSYPNQNQRNNYAKELRKPLYKQRVIKSKQNRLIILNGDVEHASIKQYNVNQRYILNINYFL